MKTSRLSIVLAATLSLLTACSKGGDSTSGSAPAGGAIKGTVRFLGSDATAILTSAIADAFKATHPEVRTEIEESNSNLGVGSAKAGMTDIGISVRELTEEEQETLDAVKIGRDGLCIIVNKENPVTTISDEQFKGIQAGAITNWKDLGGPDAKIERVNHAEVLTSLQYLVRYYGITPGDIKYSESVGNSDKDIIKSVSSVKEAVSYASIGAALNAIEHGPPIKMLGFKGVDPTVENVAEGKVPITFDMLLVAKKTADGATKAFMEFAAKDHADINKKKHFAPVKR